MPFEEAVFSNAVKTRDIVYAGEFVFSETTFPIEYEFLNIDSVDKTIVVPFGDEKSPYLGKVVFTLKNNF